MKKRSPTSVRNLVRYSLLASLTALMQVSAGLFPGPGHVVSAFGTLPVAVAAFLSPRGGVACFIISAWLTLIVLPAELPTLALGTAPLGLIIGLGLHYSLAAPVVIITGAVHLTMAMLFMTLVLGIPVFGSYLDSSAIFTLTAVYGGFSLLYSTAWLGFIKKVVFRLTRYIQV